MRRASGDQFLMNWPSNWRSILYNTDGSASYPAGHLTWPVESNLADVRKQPDLSPKRLDLGPKRPDLGPKRPDSGPERIKPAKNGQKLSKHFYEKKKKIINDQKR